MACRMLISSSAIILETPANMPGRWGFSGIISITPHPTLLAVFFRFGVGSIEEKNSFSSGSFLIFLIVSVTAL